MRAHPHQYGTREYSRVGTIGFAAFVWSRLRIERGLQRARVHFVARVESSLKERAHLHNPRSTYAMYRAMGCAQQSKEPSGLARRVL